MRFLILKLLNDFDNLCMIIEFGRREDNVFEPTELSVGRTFKVQWKKSKPNPEEMARLYWVQGLTQQQVADIMGVRRTTVSLAAKKFKAVVQKQNVPYG